MIEFMRKYGSVATSVLSGFDRVVFRGFIRSLVYPDGMKRHLSHRDVPRREFGTYVTHVTAALKAASLSDAERLGRPVIYLPSSQTRKEAVAKQVLRESPIDSGLICVLTCVEPCMAYDMYKNKREKKLQLVYRLRKCLHLYHYFIDPDFGFMHARIQTYFPFHVQICINGREYLARRLHEEGKRYTRYENSFVRLQDPERAQQLLSQLVCHDWVTTLDTLAARINPAHSKLLGPQARYYWTAHQTEWATDIAFASPKELARIYPQLVWGAITSLSTRDVMRFLGKQFQMHFAGDVDSRYQERPEGLSIKHSVNRNTIKMYDKGGSILRVETTINNPRDIVVYRPKHKDQPKHAGRHPLRKGVCDIERRTQVSQRANERYLDALAQFDTNDTLAQLIAPITKPIVTKGRRYRGLRPWQGQDLNLLEAIHQPQFLIAGLRNKDIASQLYSNPSNDTQKARANAAKVSYRLRILRAHGLIAQIPRTRRYRITRKGQQLCNVILLAQHATVQQLNPKAA